VESRRDGSAASLSVLYPRIAVAKAVDSSITSVTVKSMRQRGSGPRA
jgi:hypothetical protein